MGVWNPRGDPHFTWRGGDGYSRLEGFSDAVFGFALTLLVVSLDVPRTVDQLFKIVREAPVFFFCFGQLYTVWSNHHRFFRRFGLQDRLTIALNGALLFVVALYVYPLRFLGTLFIDGLILHRLESGITRAELRSVFGIYALGVFAVNCLFALLYRHASRHEEQLKLSGLERALTRGEARRNAGIAAVAVLSAVLAYTLPERSLVLAGFSYLLIGAVEFWHKTRVRAAVLRSSRGA